MKFHLESPEIQLRESAGLVKDVYDPVTSVREPLSAYRTMLDLIHSDATLSSAYSLITKFATYRGYDFTGGTKAQRDRHRKLFTELNFQQVLPNIMYSLNYYGDCFLELRKNDSSSINELWPLETTEMRIIYNEHGKVGGYVQRPFNMTNLSEEEVLKKEKEKITDSETGEERTQGIFFDKDEVIHFRMKWIGSQVYSYNPNEPISQIASTGLYAGNYLMNIFINMPPRYVAHLAGISNSDFTTAKREFESTKTNYKKTIAFTKSSDPTSKLTLQKIDAPYDEMLIKILSWIHGEMLKITHVPRTFIEGDTSENRGVGESLNLPFEVSLQWIHRCVLEPPINRTLLRLLKKGVPKSTETKSAKKEVKIKSEVQLRFNEISRKGENEIIMNAGLLRDMGLKPDALVAYLDERGILGIDPDDFEEQQVSKNMELNSSRERMNPGKKDMTQNRDEAGTSNKSAKKMGLKSKTATSQK